MTDEPRDPQIPGDDEEARATPPEEHQPATWAGRQKWQGLPEDEAEHEEHEPADDPLADALEEIVDEFAFEEPEDEEPEPSEPPAGGADEPEPSRQSPGEETVEADTLALADREQAREAALAGLRARTAEHAAKRKPAGPRTSQAPPAGQPAPKPQAPAPAAPKPPQALPAAPKAAQTPPAPVAAGIPDEDEAAPQRSLWARFMAASFLIIASMAAATSVSLLVYLTDIAKGLGGLEGLRGQLDAVEGDPQNFLILGSDVRPDEPGKGRSDTTMLLRVDPDKNIISQLSIPRDLRVNIPGHGIGRFNTAYSIGGPKLTLKVVKQITDDRIDVNHVVNVDFNGFADAVNAIDCVYVDVDRHYLNTNEGVAFTEQYAEINIEAGYQRLCGFKALQYVRYRHEDNDIVRAARQQTFLREARQRVPPDKLYRDRNELIDIFTEHTTSDIDDVATLVELFKLMFAARNAQINQVQFPYQSLGNEQGYVTASAAPLRSAVNEFLGIGVPSPDKDRGSGGDRSGGDGGADKPKPKPKPKPEQGPSPASVPMIDSTGSGQSYAAAIDSPEIKFPILYPTKLTPGSGISDDSRWFRIDGPGDAIYRGYKFVVTRPGTSYPTAYYGVSGTDWLDAPLFKNPSEERTIGGRNYKLYYDAGRLRMIAFQRDRAMYWVQNTLDKLLSEPQMIAVAQNLAEA